MDKTKSEELEPLLWGMARPALAWTLHFIFVYAALGAACGERGVTSFAVAVIAIVIATLVAMAVAGWSLFRSNTSEFHAAARWTTVISLVAILFSASPVLFIQSCG